MSVTEHDAPVRSALEGRFEDGDGVDLRGRTARGTIVNGVYNVAATGLGLIKGIAVAAVLTTSEYGMWGLLLAAFATLIMLGSVGIDDKYIQQDDPDQRRAFEIAFTLQCLLGVAFFLIILVGMPLFALVYGQPDMILPGMAFALAMPALALYMPIWTLYRRMDFARARKLEIIDPLASLILSVGLAAAGLGIWGLVIGSIAGTYIAVFFVLRNAVYELHFRWDGPAFRDYLSFSWPLFVSQITAFVLIQIPMIVSSRVYGVVAVAGIAFATNITLFSRRVDQIVTQTLYPAICAVKDRPPLLLESFWKSNRLALLWAAPLGAAAALFVGDFVHWVLGDDWKFAVPLVAAYGVAAAIDQIGFNWSAFFRAIGRTRPMVVESTIGLIAVVAIAVPLLAFVGLTAFGVGLGIAALVSVAVRTYYLRQIFPGFPMLAHVVRGIGPVVPGVALVLVLRELETGPRTLAQVGAEVALFLVATGAATWLSDRALLREAIGYLRRRSVAPASA